MVKLVFKALLGRGGKFSLKRELSASHNCKRTSLWSNDLQRIPSRSRGKMGWGPTDREF